MGFVFSQAAMADLLVSIGDAVLVEGGTGYVDVTIESNQLPGDPMSLFGFDFRIDTAGPTRLEFVNPQSDWQLSSPDYVLAGDSAASLFPPVGVVTTTVVPNDTYIGGDGTDSGGDVLVTSLSRLLVRLDLTAQTALPPVAGDTFTIELVPNLNTFFLDAQFNDVAFQSTIGTVLIVPVPEPTSIALFVTGALVASMWPRKKRQKRRKQRRLPLPGT